MKLSSLGVTGCRHVAVCFQPDRNGRTADRSRDMQEEAKHEELLRMLREGWDLCLLYGSHSDSVTEKLIGRLPEELPLIPVGSEAAAWICGAGRITAGHGRSRLCLRAAWRRKEGALKPVPAAAKKPENGLREKLWRE